MNRRRFTVLGILCTIFTVLLAATWVFPIYWILVTAFKDETQTTALPPTFVPSPPTLEAFAYVFQNSPIVRWYLNTVVSAAVVTFLTVLLCLMCAYALSRLSFRGKSFVYTFLLIGFMLPFQSVAIPLFMFMNQLHLVNSYAGLILPQVAASLSVIVFKSFFDEVPSDFRSAALVDGASEWRILFGIYIPLNWSIIWAMSIVTFIGCWNNFFWPLIITNSTPMLTIPVGMTQVQSAYGVIFARTSAVAVLASLPTVLAYVLFQKRVTDGITAAAGLKG